MVQDALRDTLFHAGSNLRVGANEHCGEEEGRRSKRQRLELERVVDVSHKFLIPAANLGKPPAIIYLRVGLISEAGISAYLIIASPVCLQHT